MNKKILVGVILLLFTVFISVGMFLMDVPITFFLNVILPIVAFAGVLIILRGMAQGKKIFKTYGYHGDLNALLGIVEKSITQMDLKVKNKSISDNSFYFTFSERMRWLTTNWPVHFDIKAEKSKGIINLNVQAWAQIFSITQARYTQQKAQEFLDLVKNYAPNREDYSKRDTVDMRYIRGEITKGEYEQMYKDLKG